MLINLHTQDKKGRELYKNALTGRVAPLNQQDFYPSQRRDNQVMSGISKKVSSTKKSKNANKIASKLSQFFGFVFTGKEKVKKARQENKK